MPSREIAVEAAELWKLLALHGRVASITIDGDRQVREATAVRDRAIAKAATDRDAFSDALGEKYGFDPKANFVVDDTKGVFVVTD